MHLIRGQHIFLYPPGHPIYDGHLQPLHDDDIAALRARVGDVLGEDKYLRLAELAGV